MSASRTDTLTTIGYGIRKFEGFTASELLESGWSGLSGLHLADFDYFAKYGDLPAMQVAKACQCRSRYCDPLAVAA